ncbi:MAG: rod shape-determining protein MreD [Stygiobacter sp.]|jgi:rod shape-determining protein MreD|uniref:Rod shape-determining protein MreD n=1 Tax=Stygiobacter electus TaxID=3032292 RepID=A0AAE3NYH5_9BACT|nr:rod shape-determining protein MreD [Stygiobacter electus]MDF1611099.1 rod shape-determining protein MreD [Stygiobacter electus]
MINYLKPILIFIPIILVQLIIVPLISIYEIVPQLILILLVYYTLIGGQIYGMILGFIVGFLFDLFSGGILGSSALAMTVSMFILGYFYNENRIQENTATYSFLVYLLFASIIYSLIYSEVGNFNPDTRLRVILFEGALLPALYTTLFGILVVVFQSKRKFE